MIRRAALLASAGLLGAFLLLVLAPHRSYSPGALSKGHQPISSQCATCHSAWRGVVNQRCIDCHGDYSAHNPHGGAKVSDPHDGVAPGFHLASASDKLSCLSCHTDHRGRNVNVSAEAGSNCTWCHKHPSIDDVTAHTKSQMQRPSGSTHVFKQAYSHAKHLELISQKDPSVKALNCRSCHVLEPQGKSVEVTDRALDLLTEKGYSVQYGARFLKRHIDERVKLPITTLWKSGSRFVVDVEDGEVVTKLADESDENAG